MDRQKLLDTCDVFLAKLKAFEEQTTEFDSKIPTAGARAEVAEFLRRYAGPKNAFLARVNEVSGWPRHQFQSLWWIVKSFRDFVEAGLHEEITPERRAQLDVVSDFLGQAETLLATKNVHPAAPAVLIGAALEEFLRTWAESAELSLGNRKPGLQAYTDVLRDDDLITKQDAKDITSWAGIRNHAAHGEWAEVADPTRVRLMLEGVNLFMRKYGA
ncbi:MAG TPA: hypothetical protein VGQ36_03740 [Thermoanaerobaculia bacterium]|jgi:hypothetical protein|nr:hypothetical protein [Thermoanaerobaculia bacterium]